jgi:hypothetical protein
VRNLFGFRRNGASYKYFVFSIFILNSEMPVNPACSVTEVMFHVAAKREQILNLAEAGLKHRLASRGALFVNAGPTDYWRSHPKTRAESRTHAERRERRAARRLFAKVVALALMIFFIWICFKIIGALLNLFEWQSCKRRPEVDLKPDPRRSEGFIAEKVVESRKLRSCNRELPKWISEVHGEFLWKHQGPLGAY